MSKRFERRPKRAQMHPKACASHIQCDGFCCKLKIHKFVVQCVYLGPIENFVRVTYDASELSDPPIPKLLEPYYPHGVCRQRVLKHHVI